LPWISNSRPNTETVSLRDNLAQPAEFPTFSRNIGNPSRVQIDRAQAREELALSAIVRWQGRNHIAPGMGLS
jgi:hypothetical protein